MAEQATRMRRLIDDLLSLTRIELNEHVRPAGSVNIGDVVEEVANATVADGAGGEHADRDRRADVVAQCRGRSRRALSRCVQNLVDNAIKYGRPQSDDHGRVGYAPRGARARRDRRRPSMSPCATAAKALRASTCRV